MHALWTEELTAEEESALIAKISGEIKKRRMEVPAVFFLEMHKPLAGLASNAMIVGSPFVGPFLGMDNVHDFSRLLAKQGGVERLIRAIETPAPMEGQEGTSP